MAKECHQRKLSSGLWQLQQSGRFCDMLVTVGGNIQIQVHAAMLAATSNELCSMLEQEQQDNTSRYRYHLDVAEYDERVVRALLEFIYTGELVVLTSLDCSIRDDLVRLCVKLGITVDTDNSSATDSQK